ncbi:MAG TPA: LuxR C-terminal-related transcriptional regulator [Bacillales bacterium]|nr:LuxR C-terminal-related transcriptional regulator [Bacillales bacterium]
MENKILSSCFSKNDIYRHDPTMISRPRLLQKLDKSLEGTLTLICAPAGYGKTTLVNNWLKKRELSAVQLSFRSGAEKDGFRFLREFQPDLSPLIAEAQLYVFDDCQCIQSASVFERLSLFISALPPRSHTIVMTRIEPSLPLSKLRLSGRLNEIRQQDLRLDKAESFEWFKSCTDTPLTESEYDQIENWTEGWPIALSFAARCMIESHSAAKVVDILPGHPGFADYLQQEVFCPLSNDLQIFLMKTSVTEWIMPGLCDRLVGEEQGQKGFEKIKRLLLFENGIGEGKTGLKYHSLFAAFLRSEASKRLGPEVAVLHRRASQWFEEHGYKVEAVDQALEAKDYENTLRLIHQYAPHFFRIGKQHFLRKWMEGFPEFPSSLIIVEAWAKALQGECDTALTRHDEVNGGNDAEISFVKGYIALCRYEAKEAFEWFRKATEEEGRAGQFFQGGMDLNQGEVQILRGPIGMGGRLNDAEWLYKERMRKLWKHKEPGVLGYGSDIMAELLYERNQREGLMYFIIRGIELGKRHRNIGILVSVHFIYMRLKWTEGRVNEGWAIYENIKKTVEESYDPERWLPVLTAFEIRMMLQEISPSREELENWLTKCSVYERTDPDFAVEYEVMTYVRVLMFLKQYSRALRIVNQWLDKAEKAGRIGSQIEMYILRALISQKKNNSKRAAANIWRALSLGEPERYIRSFLDERYPLAELLASSLRKNKGSQYEEAVLAYGHKLLGLFEQELGVSHWSASNQSLVEPLTQRELEILGYVEEGLSNSVIAGRLGIKTGTVKGYLINLYGKLGVQSRIQAAVKAKELELVRR